MPFLNESNFSFGEVSPEYQLKKEIIGTMRALKTAKNIAITAGGSVAKRAGCIDLGAFLVDSVITRSTLVRIVPFVFNRFQSYVVTFAWKEIDTETIEDGVVTQHTKSGIFIDVYDNTGSFVSGGLATVYTKEQVMELSYNQVNDVMYLYHPDRAIQTLTRQVSPDDDLFFSLEEYRIKQFYTIEYNDISLAFFYHQVKKAWVLYSSRPLFNDGHIGKIYQLLLPQEKKQFDRTVSSPYDSLKDANHGLIRANTYTITIVPSAKGIVELCVSRDGTAWETDERREITPGSTNTFTYADDGSPHYFKYTLQATGSTKVTELYPDYTYYAKCQVTEIIDDMSVIVQPLTDEFFELQPDGLTYGKLADWTSRVTSNYLQNDWDAGMFSTSIVTDTTDWASLMEQAKQMTDEKNKQREWLEAQTRTSVKMGVPYSRVWQPYYVKIHFKDTQGQIAPQYISSIRISWTLVGSDDEPAGTYVGDTAFYVRNKDGVDTLLRRDKVNHNYACEAWFGNYHNIVEFRIEVLKGDHDDIVAGLEITGLDIISTNEDKIIVNFESYTHFWGEESMSNDSNNKGLNAKTGCIFQNRHFIANTFVLASKLADYANFGNDDQNNVATTSPFVVMQNTFKYGRILHLLPFKQGILALSTDHEIFIYAQGLLTPSTASQQVLGERGSEDVRPLVLEQGYIGVERGGNLFFQSFSFGNASYERVDISKYIKHLMHGRTIKQIEGLMASDNTIFILMNDGKLIRLYFDLTAQIMAFSHMEIDAFITNITIVDEVDGKYLWAITDQNELLKFSKTTDKYPCYLDKAKKFEDCESFVVDGIANGSVALCYDENGYWSEPINESVGETHTLQKKAIVCYVGKTYETEIETLDIGGADDNFSAAKSKVNTVILHLVDALGVEVNGEKLKFDTTESDYPKAYTGKYKTAYFGKYGRDKTVRITSNAPYGFTLASINASVGGA